MNKVLIIGINYFNFNDSVKRAFELSEYKTYHTKKASELSEEEKELIKSIEEAHKQLKTINKNK
jgi:hypothetical protein